MQHWDPGPINLRCGREKGCPPHGRLPLCGLSLHRGLWSKAPNAVAIFLFFDGDHLPIQTVSSEEAQMVPVAGPSPVPGTQWSSTVTTDLCSWQAVRKSLRTLTAPLASSERAHSQLGLLSISPPTG